ncbi:hypothetical protein GCM10027569_18680 [Flindersiella endophytica]
MAGAAAFTGLVGLSTPSLAAAPVSQATASALTVSLAGRSAGSGEFKAVYNGSELVTEGENVPKVPALENQTAVVGGALGQDAIASSDGTSAACAGLVARNGTVELGPHGSCLPGGHGKVELSLGTLSELGLDDLIRGLPETPDLPLPDLPGMELRIVGDAIFARCSAEPGTAAGSSSVVDAEVVAIVDGQRIPIADIPPGGLSLGLDDVLDKLPEIPGLSDLLKQLPTDQIPANLLSISTGEKSTGKGKITVTALRVAVVPETLLDVSVGKVTCGPNRKVAGGGTPPKPTQAPSPGPASVPTSVPAGLESLPAGEAQADKPQSFTIAGVGIGGAATIALCGLLLGGYFHRLRKPSRQPDA